VKTDQNQQGMVLLIVMASIAIITSLLYTLMDGGRFTLYKVENELNLQQAYYQARSAIPEILRQLDDATDTTHITLDSSWTQPIQLPWDPEGEVTIEVEDITRMWNLNALIRKDSSDTVNESIKTALITLLERNGYEDNGEELVDVVVEWVSKSDEESELFIDLPYQPRNGPMQYREELLLLPGWDRTLLDLLDKSITVNGDCPQSKLNPNTANPETLLAHDVIDTAESALHFIGERNYDPSDPDLDQEIKALSQFTTACFSAKISATVGKVTAKLVVNIKKEGQKTAVTAIDWNG